MASSEEKKRIYDQFARIGKALASASRLELLDLLTQGERSVEELAGETGMTVANTSQHLQTLLAARLVDTRKVGLRVIYRVAAPEVVRLWLQLRTTTEQQLVELDSVASAYLKGREQFEPIGRDELAARVREGRTVVIDVRPKTEFDYGHITGAISVPLGDLDAFARTLPGDAEVVAYCRGPYCVFALDAARRLRDAGIIADRADVGVAEWQAAGLPVEYGGGAAETRRA